MYATRPPKANVNERQPTVSIQLSSSHLLLPRRTIVSLNSAQICHANACSFVHIFLKSSRLVGLFRLPVTIARFDAGERALRVDMPCLASLS